MTIKRKPDAFSVTAIREKCPNWTTSVDALSLGEALNKGLKAHYDAGFTPVTEVISVIVKNDAGEKAGYKVTVKADDRGNCQWKSETAEIEIEEKKVKTARKRA